MTTPSSNPDTIDQLRAEIERLTTLATADQLGAELRDAFILGAASRIIATSVSHDHQLQMIVRTAASVIAVRAASLFILDHVGQQLVVAAATGPKSEAMSTIAIPIGHGLAGLVALSGQAMGVSDVAHDPRAAQDIMHRIGYHPTSMLCVPVTRDGDVVGVLEVLDKADGTSFGAWDIAVLGSFAEQAAVALEHARSHQVFVALINHVLRYGPTSHAHALEEQVDSFLTDIESDPTYARALELARLVQRIGTHGEREATACKTILTGFAEYLDARTGAHGLG